MSKLDYLIQKLCPNGVEYKDLENCCNILDSKRKPVTKSARKAGEYPYYGANGVQDYVSEYIFDGKFVLVGEDGSVINDRGNPIVTWAEGKIWVNNHAHIIEEIEGVSLRYLYHYIQTINVSSLIHGNIPKLNQGDFRKLPIAVPPLEVQCEIVHILDDLTLLSAKFSNELSAELRARQRQYEYFKNKMFEFDNDVEKIQFGELCDIVTKQTGFDYTKTIKNSLKREYTENTIPYIQTKFFEGKNFQYNTDYFIPIEIAEKFPKIILDKKAILLSIVGASIGNIGLFEGKKKCFLGGAICVAKVSEKYNIDYIFYYLTSHFGQRQIFNKVKGAGQATVTIEDIRNFLIPMPSIEKQNDIVLQLSKLEKLSNNISVELESEIEARQKQYEYYRDKLLTFKESKVNE